MKPEWEHWRDEARTMLDGGNHEWAREILQPLADYATQHEEVTPAQAREIKLIRDAGAIRRPVNV